MAIDRLSWHWKTEKTCHFQTYWAIFVHCIWWSLPVSVLNLHINVIFAHYTSWSMPVGFVIKYLRNQEYRSLWVGFMLLFLLIGKTKLCSLSFFPIIFAQKDLFKIIIKAAVSLFRNRIHSLCSLRYLCFEFVYCAPTIIP